MRLFTRTGLLIFFFCKLINVSASSTASSEITYKYIGNNQYHVVIHFFRDCRGIALNPGSLNIGYRAGTAGSTACGSGTLTGFVRTKIIDVNTRCSTKNSPCNPANTYGTGEGMEDHIFEDTLDLSKSPFNAIIANSSCDELVIYAGICCRSGAITTGSAGNNFYVSTTIYLNNIKRCKNQINNSVQFDRRWPSFLCCNQPVYASMGGIDSLDNDSLSYALVTGLSALPNISIAYGAAFTYRYPLSVYCSPPTNNFCPPNILVSVPRGFYISESTGDIIFTTSKCDEVGIVVVEATEWRRDTSGKMLPIAKTRRDHQFIVKDDCGYNKAPTIAGPFFSKAIAGDTLCLDFVLNDETFSPYQTSHDSIRVNWAGSKKEPSWSLKSDTIPNRKFLRFCWKPEIKDVKSMSYPFSIQVNDQHCPKPALSSRTFEVLVQERDSAAVIISTGATCSGVILQPWLKRGKLSDGLYTWNVYDSITGIKIFNGSSNYHHLKYLKKGSYRVQLSVDHKLYGYRPVTAFFRITTEMPKVNLGADQFICKFDSFSAQAIVTAMTPPLIYEWTVGKNLDSFQKTGTFTKSKVDTSFSLLVMVKDSNSCQVRDTMMLTKLDLPKVEWVKNPLNPVCWTPEPISLNNKILSPASHLLKPGSFRISGSLTKYGKNGLADSGSNGNYSLNASLINNELELSNGKSVTENLTLWFTDSFGCRNSAETKITILGIPVIQLQSKTVCQNQGTLKMDSLRMKPKSVFGLKSEWLALKAPAGINPLAVLKDNSGGSGLDWVFSFGNPSNDHFAGKYLFRHKLTNLITGCAATDSVEVLVIAEPVLTSVNGIQYCEGQSDIDLIQTFLVSGNLPLAQFAGFRILSLNGDTTATKWGNTKINGRFLTGNPASGNWNIGFTYTQNGCPESGNNVITIKPAPKVRFTSNPDSLSPISFPVYNTSNITSIPGGEDISYKWYFAYPDSIFTSKAFSPQIIYPAIDSTYTVRLEAKSKGGCQGFFEKVLQVGRGTAAGVFFKDISQLVIDHNFVIHGLRFTEIDIRIFDHSGKLVLRKTNNLPVQLSPGIYFYQVIFNDGMRTTGFSGKKLLAD